MATANGSPKSNEKAAQIRQEGNHWYKQKAWDDALRKYNESICWAESGSEDLAIGIANRSAVYFEMKEYEFALANIRLARKHNYPVRLMPKLEARERDCHREISQDPPGDDITTKCLYSKLDLKVEANPRIPFLANGIQMNQTSSGKLSVFATRDFKVGDVILQEKSLFNCLDSPMDYHCCDYCSGNIYHCLIPCPRCTTALFCGEECLEKSWNFWHRFECGDVREKLSETYNKCEFFYMGPRLFFYGLSLFKDDVERMMEFCKTRPKPGSDALSLDYVNYDPLEEFKAIHYITHQRQEITPNDRANVKIAAEKYFKIYQRSALVRSLFSSITKKAFMKQHFLDYCKGFLGVSIFNGTLYELGPITSNFDVSYSDSNVAVLSKEGQLKLVVHRAVPKGSHLKVQLCFGLANSENCSDCADHLPLRDSQLLLNLTENPTVDSFARLNATQQFVQKHSNLYTRCIRFRAIVDMYLNTLSFIYNIQAFHAIRAKAIEDT